MVEANPDLWNYTGHLDYQCLNSQYEAFTELVKGSGAEVEWIPAENDDLADSIFTYDPSFVTGQGAILLRAVKKLREPEVELHKALYELSKVATASGSTNLHSLLAEASVLMTLGSTSFATSWHPREWIW